MPSNKEIYLDALRKGREKRSTVKSAFVESLRKPNPNKPKPFESLKARLDKLSRTKDRLKRVAIARIAMNSRKFKRGKRNGDDDNAIAYTINEDEAPKPGEMPNATAPVAPTGPPAEQPPYSDTHEAPLINESSPPPQLPQPHHNQ